MSRRSGGGTDAWPAALLVDGTNLLHRIAGGPDPASRRLLLARLRAALPPGRHAIVVLDGHPDPGAPPVERIGPDLEVRHAGGRTADDAIVAWLEERPFGARIGTTVVTDDAELAARARRAGATPRRVAWLDRQLDRPAGGARGRAGSTIGRGRRPTGS